MFAHNRAEEEKQQSGLRGPEPDPVPGQPRARADQVHHLPLRPAARQPRAGAGLKSVSTYYTELLST